LDEGQRVAGGETQAVGRQAEGAVDRLHRRTLVVAKNRQPLRDGAGGSANFRRLAQPLRHLPGDMGGLQPVARRPVGVAAEQRQVGTRAGHDPPGASQGCCRGADGLESKQRRGAGHQVQPPAGRQMRLDQVKNSVISGVSNQPH
jgi:hypothetical protein